MDIIIALIVTTFVVMITIMIYELFALGEEDKEFWEKNVGVDEELPGRAFRQEQRR